MSVAIQYFLNTNRAKLDDWYANQNTTTFGLWRNREVVLLKKDDSLIKMILWKIAHLFGLISQQSHPIEIIKEFYIQHKAHQVLAQKNAELSARVNSLADEILKKRAESEKLTEEITVQSQACDLLRNERGTLTTEVYAATQTLHKVETDLEKKTISLRGCASQLAQAEATITKVEQLRSQLSGLEKSIQAAEKKSARLSALIKRLEDLRDGIPAAQLNPNTILELNTQRTQIEQSMIRLIENGTWVQVDGKGLPEVLNETYALFKQYKFKELTWLETLQQKASALQSGTLTTTNTSFDTKSINDEFKALAQTFYTYVNTLQSLAHTGYGLVL